MELSGIVEGDEKYFPISYKGNRMRSGTKIPRESRRRGSEVGKRGLSDGKACVPRAVSRTGLSIAVVTNSGKPSAEDIGRAFSGRIKAGADFCCDKMNSYKKFAEKNGLTLHLSKSEASCSGIFNIQRVNNYHSRLDKFMSRYNFSTNKTVLSRNVRKRPILPWSA